MAQFWIMLSLSSSVSSCSVNITRMAAALWVPTRIKSLTLVGS